MNKNLKNLDRQDLKNLGIEEKYLDEYSNTDYEFYLDREKNSYTCMIRDRELIFENGTTKDITDMLKECFYGQLNDVVERINQLDFENNGISLHDSEITKKKLIELCEKYYKQENLFIELENDFANCTGDAVLDYNALDDILDSKSISFMTASFDTDYINIEFDVLENNGLQSVIKVTNIDLL